MHINLEENWQKQQWTWSSPKTSHEILVEDEVSEVHEETRKGISHVEPLGQQDRERSPRRKAMVETSDESPPWERGGRISPNPGQGDCLFHVFCQAIEAPGQKKRARRQLRSFLAAKMKEKFDFFSKRWDHTDARGQETDMTFQEYINEVAKPGNWASKFEAQILAELLGLRVLIHTSWDKIVDINPEGKRTACFSSTTASLTGS